MSSFSFVFVALVFALTLSVSLVLLSLWMPKPGHERLARLMSANQPSPPHAWRRSKNRLQSALLWFSPWAASFSGGSSDAPGEAPSALKQQFAHAGWRSFAALQMYFTSKTMLTLLLPAVAWLVITGNSWTLHPMVQTSVLIVCATAGYYLPNLFVKMRVQRRQLALLHAFADALDLLRVCVQAGLGLDAAMERVGREMRYARPELSEEFALTGLALRAGSSRAEALRGLSLRVGLKDIDALVSVLIQADRFGSSVSDALLVHSDALRSQRRLRAEEAAAKLPVKLLIPLIFCVFPSLLTVLLGPVVVTLSHQFSKTAGA